LPPTFQPGWPGQWVVQTRLLTGFDRLWADLAGFGPVKVLKHF
jgi:hypothetical protein